MPKADPWLQREPLLAAATLAVSCERCGAGPGQRCWRPNKSAVRIIEAKEFHAPRIAEGYSILAEIVDEAD